MNKKINKIIIVSFIFFIVACGGGISDDVDELSGGYCYCFEGNKDDVIIKYSSNKKDRYIPCDIIAYDYDDSYIIASQKPMSNCFIGLDTIHYPSTDSIFYWIIDHKRKLFLGPLVYRDYLIKREQLKVPEDLVLR